ncbi:MAG TPA: APC family permease [Smithellaceae bacterium]|nr:APC family permease [Smithellaceae bacterium]
MGKPRDVNEPSIFHKLSLIPILAWIGLGADGLSSSSYGPEEAYKVLGSHSYIGLLIGLATAFTVFIIAYAYSRIIEHFPQGGGGYIVSTKTISNSAGVISGSALIVDYMLTITVSLVACGDAIFSFLPIAYQKYKLIFVAFLILMLVIMNLRGVKESILALAPIFIVFISTHVLLVVYGIVHHADQFGLVLSQFHSSFKQDIGTIGFIGILAIFLRAFSMGGGTYTGIEAVSNGIQIMREPRVQTGKRTMLYMAVSLAFTAGGLLICYALLQVKPVEGKTLNAILAAAVFHNWPLSGAIVFLTILSEGALLLVAAQAGFVDGPRVMANMATDFWLPHRFAMLSERLTMQNGIILMGTLSLILLFYTHGSISALIVMYSINVFLTFSLSESGMIIFSLRNTRKDEKWKRHIAIHVAGFILCITILCTTVYEKFGEGGWMTLLITAALIALCYLIKKHYLNVRGEARKLENILQKIHPGKKYNNEPLNPREPTAIILVSGFNGFGLHTLFSINRKFPHFYKNFIFVSIAEVDQASFKGSAEMEQLRIEVENGLKKYVKLVRSFGMPADHRMDAGTDVVETATKVCQSLAKEFPKSMVFTGKLIFHQEHFYQRALHNETAYAIQRRLQWDGIESVIMPIRV